MPEGRQLVLVKPEPGADHGTTGQLQPMGQIPDIRAGLARFNTAPDGSVGASLGTERFYGPGFVMQFPTTVETVNQIMVNVNEDDMAWAVLSKICRAMDWRMMDMETGKVFGE